MVGSLEHPSVVSFPPDVNRNVSVLMSGLISLQHHRNLVVHLQVFPDEARSNPTEMTKAQSSYLTCRSFAPSGETRNSSCPKFWKQKTNFLKTAYYIFFCVLSNFSLLIGWVYLRHFKVTTGMLGLKWAISLFVFCFPFSFLGFYFVEFCGWCKCF